MLPESNAVPPEEAAYQSVVQPEGGVDEMETVPGPQLLPPVPVGAAGLEFTVATTAVRVVETQPVDVLRAWA